MNSFQMKFLGWSFWILSAASVANMAVFGFKFWTSWITVNLMIIAAMAFGAAVKEEATKKFWKDFHARTNEPGRD